MSTYNPNDYTTGQNQANQWRQAQNQQAGYASPNQYSSGPSYNNSAGASLGNTGMQRVSNANNQNTAARASNPYGASNPAPRPNAGMNATYSNTATQPTYTTGQDQARGGGQQPPRQTTPYGVTPLPGQPTGDRNNPGGQYWQPPYPTPVQTQPPAQPNQYGWQDMPGLNYDAFAGDDQREQVLEYIQAMLPYNQYMSNQQQWSTEYQEAARRWDQQFGHQAGLDQFNTQLASQQQLMAEWQAQEAANQWAATFGQQQTRDQYEMGLATQQFDLQDWQTRQQMAQGDRNLSMQEQASMWQNQQSNRGMDIAHQQNLAQNQLAGQGLTQQQWMNEQNVQLQQGAQEIDRMYRTGQLTNEQRQLALAELTQGQNNQLANQQFGLSEWQAQQSVGLQQNAQRIDEMYRTGQISNEQRQLALAELSQQQNMGFQYSELDSTNAWRQQQDQLARWQQEQQMQIQREQIEANRKNAILQATGRSGGMAPNARWLRAA